MTQQYPQKQHQQPWGLAPIPENIPLILRRLPGWCPWNAYPVPGGGKPLKIPKCTTTGHNAKTTLPEQWGPFVGAWEWYCGDSRGAGVGLLVLLAWRLSFWDFDGCINEKGEIAPVMLELMRQYPTYWERSPSGRGLRAVFIGEVPASWGDIGRGTIRDEEWGIDIGVEAYAGHSARYVTFTGHRVDGCSVEVLPISQENLATLYIKVRGVADVGANRAASGELADLDGELMLLDEAEVRAEYARLRDKLKPHHLALLEQGWDVRPGVPQDRSVVLRSTIRSLLHRGLSHDLIYSLLVYSPGSWQVAMDHRAGRTEKAQRFLTAEVARAVGKHRVDAEASAPKFEVQAAADLAGASNVVSFPATGPTAWAAWERNSMGESSSTSEDSSATVGSNPPDFIPLPPYPIPPPTSSPDTPAPPYPISHPPLNAREDLWERADKMSSTSDSALVSEWLADLVEWRRRETGPQGTGLTALDEGRLIEHARVRLGAGKAEIKSQLKTVRRELDAWFETWGREPGGGAGPVIQGMNLQTLPYQDRDPQGLPYTSVTNVRLVLEALRMRIRFDMCKRRPMAEGMAHLCSDERSKDAVEVALADILQRAHFRSLTARLPGVLDEIAFQGAYHPFAEGLWLRSKEGGGAGWDGVERVQRVIECLPVAPARGEGQAQAEAWRNLVVRRWLVSFCAAAQSCDVPGLGTIPLRLVLVLQGPEYTGKTTWLRRLLPDVRWFAEGRMLDLHKVDSKREATEALLCELGELDSTTLGRGDMPALKAFLSAEEDTYRTPYARGPRSYKRRTVFAGTVNRWDFLRDRGHNSRYAVLSIVGMVDFERMREVLGAQGSEDHWQFWLEVQEWYRRGGDEGRWWLEGSELQWVKDTNQAFVSGGDLYDVAREALESIWDFEDECWAKASLQQRADAVRDQLDWCWAKTTKEVMTEVVRELQHLGKEGPGRGIVMQVLKEMTGQQTGWVATWDPRRKGTVKPYLMPRQKKVFGMTPAGRG